MSDKQEEEEVICRLFPLVRGSDVCATWWRAENIADLAAKVGRHVLGKKGKVAAVTGIGIKLSDMNLRTAYHKNVSWPNTDDYFVMLRHFFEDREAKVDGEKLMQRAAYLAQSMDDRFGATGVHCEDSVRLTVPQLIELAEAVYDELTKSEGKDQEK